MKNACCLSLRYRPMYTARWRNADAHGWNADGIHAGANAAVLCYDITDPKSFEEMGRWLIELKNNLGDDIILHVVGTKVDRVAEDPSARKVPFERCIAYVAENLFPQQMQQDKQTTSVPRGLWGVAGVTGGSKDESGMASPQSNRSSGFWGQDVGWDCCHEISAKDGEGVEEVFRVITRKLVEQRNKAMEQEFLSSGGVTPAINGGPGQGGYFDYSSSSAAGSFRVGVGDKRRSWLGFPTPSPGIGGLMQNPGGEEWNAEIERIEKKSGKCC